VRKRFLRSGEETDPHLANIEIYKLRVLVSHIAGEVPADQAVPPTTILKWSINYIVIRVQSLR
jgi:hypothetical protein